MFTGIWFLVLRFSNFVGYGNFQQRIELETHCSALFDLNLQIFCNGLIELWFLEIIGISIESCYTSLPKTNELLFNFPLDFPNMNFIVLSITPELRF
jgi:hypothetical protein